LLRKAGDSSLTLGMTRYFFVGRREAKAFQSMKRLCFLPQSIIRNNVIPNHVYRDEGPPTQKQIILKWLIYPVTYILKIKILLQVMYLLYYI